MLQPLQPQPDSSLHSGVISVCFKFRLKFDLHITEGSDSISISASGQVKSTPVLNREMSAHPCLANFSVSQACFELWPNVRHVFFFGSVGGRE